MRLDDPGALVATSAVFPYAAYATPPMRPSFNGAMVVVPRARQCAAKRILGKELP